MHAVRATALRGAPTPGPSRHIHNDNRANYNNQKKKKKRRIFMLALL